MSDYFRQASVGFSTFRRNEAWVILSHVEQRIREKISQNSIPLKQSGVKIYRGILTGYNEAFIIDSNQREKLIAKSPKSAEIIRPILRGKDIKKYGALNQKEWIIIVPCGWTNERRGQNDPELFFKQSYPAIYEHLIEKAKLPSKGKGLFKRDDQGNYWWELRPCEYLDEFKKDKILYIDIMTDNEAKGYPFPCFSYAKDDVFTLNTAYFMTGETKHLKYILGVLNSKVGRFIVKNNVTPLQKRQYRMFQQFVDNFPIPKATANEEGRIMSLVDSIITDKKKGLDTIATEKEINNILFSMLCLTEEEIQFIYQMP